MKKYVLLFTIHCSLFAIAFAQNLVPNWSFEEYSSCPDGAGQINKAIPWINPSASSPDYYHGCSSIMKVPNIGGGKGYQEAKTGIAYAAFFAFDRPNRNSREYIQVQLKDTLKAGISYCVSFYVNLPEVMDYAVGSMGAYFSSTAVSSTNYNVLPYTPQIANPTGNLLSSKTNWMPIQDTLVAAGGELYITIGNFKTDVNSDTVRINNGDWDISYYLVDDVSVIPLIDAIDAGRDTLITCGDTVTLGVETDTNYMYSWFPAMGLSNTAAAQPLANPAVTTTYYLTVNPSTCSKTDSVRVTVLNCKNTIYVPNVFSPNADGTKDEFKVQGNKIKQVSCKIYNRWGQEIIKVEQSPLNHSEVNVWDGRTVSGVECPTGVYVYYLTGTFTDGEPINKWGNVTLIR